MRGHSRDDHEGPQADARHRGGARRGRAGGRGRRRLSVNVSDLFDRAAATYNRAPFPFFTPSREALVEFAALNPDDRVLDAGCGSGAVRDEPEAGLREWARVLKPDGRLALATWAPGDERWAWERQLRIQPHPALFSIAGQR